MPLRARPSTGAVRDAELDLFSGGYERDLGKRLAAAGRVAVGDVLGVRPGERLVLITNPAQTVFPIARAVHDAAVAAGADAVLVVQARRGANDPIDPVALAALEADPDVLVMLTADKLGVDPVRAERPIMDRYAHYFQYLIGEGRSRGFWSPGITQKEFERLVPLDYPALRAQAAAMVGALEDAVELHVTSPAGTDLTIPIEAAAATADDGDLRVSGKGGNLPCGEVLVPVRPGAASGTLAIDATLMLPDGPVRPRTPVGCTVEEGVVTQIGGAPESDLLQGVFADARRHADAAVKAGRLTRDQATVYAGNVRRVAEIGFGLNPNAKVSGRPLVDDKALGSVHIVLGSGSLEVPPGAPVAVDAVLDRPSVAAVAEDGTERPLIVQGTMKVGVGPATLSN